MSENSPVPLPKGWPTHTARAFVHAASLARQALTVVRGWALGSPVRRVQLRAKVEGLEAELALTRAELELLWARFERLAPKHRPHFTPPERLRALELRAARGWNAAELARQLLLAPATVSKWFRLLHEGGEQALLKTREPVNRFPDLVRQLAQELSALLPHMGNQRLSDLLARAGLHLSASTVRRMQKATVVGSPPRTPVAGGSTARDTDSGRRVTARAPGHVWHVDSTLVPTGFRSGYWTSWWPWALLPVYPFCLHVLVVVDHFSRKLLGWEVFRQEPSAREVCALLERTLGKVGRAPKYVITDQGSQYRDEYRAWCREHGVKPRFGAVGQKGSIALVERFIKSLKVEALRRVWIWSVEQLRAEVGAYAIWYNGSRPHQSLSGCTPNEVYEAVTPARDGPRFEPRRRFPLGTKPSKHVPAKVRGKRGVKLGLVAGSVHGRAHLPTVELRRAA